MDYSQNNEDAPWVLVQKKTFTKWLNQNLVPVGTTISDLYKDFNNGINLICLLQVLFKDEITPRYNKHPKFAIHCCENLNPCFKYLVDKKKMRLINIGPMDIYNGNHKLTLALIFQIILIAQVDNIEVDGLKGAHGLLLWVNRQIEPYGEHVNEFTESWRNGKAFAALAAALCEGYDFNKCNGMSQDDRHASAYEKIEEDLKVAKLLDPEDFQNKEIDDKSVLTYVSTIFNAVASGDESRRHVQAIDKVAQTAMKHGSLIIKYEKEAKAYNGVLDKKIDYFKETEPKDSKECRRLIKELDEYKKGEKNDINNKKTDLASMLSDIHDSEKNENRPLYIPPEGLGPNEISQKYRDLEEAEGDYENRLLKKFKYFLAIETLMNQLEFKCNRLNDRLNKNMDSINMKDLGNSVGECMQKINDLDEMENEDEDTEKEINELHDILEDFPKDCSEFDDGVKKVEDVEKTKQKWDDDKQMYREKLLANLEKQQELEKMERDMVKDSNSIDDHLDHIELLLGKSNGEDPFGTAEASAGTAEARNELEKVKDQIEDLKGKQKDLKKEGKVDEMKKHPIKPKEDRVAAIEDALKRKQDELDAINAHAEECNKALQEYDDLANDVQEYVERNTEDLKKNKEATPQEQLRAIEKKQADYKRPPECYKVMKEKEKQCRSIGTATEDFGPINSIWSEYGKFLDRKADKLRDDEERKKMESLSPEEEELMEKVYNSLNTDGSGLSVDQLREALQAMGINMSITDIMSKLRAMGYDVGPGLRIKLPDFKRFLLELKATKNNKEDIQSSWKYLAKNGDKIAGAEIDRYFKDCKSYPYLKESLPEDEQGLCDYKEWTESAFKH